MRKQFQLPEQDVEFLESNSFLWETISINGNWVIIHDYPIPDGYNVNKSSLALRIDSGYPTSQIDMVYFLPHLTRIDGKSINALAFQQIDGKQWQRWSRHRTSANPWRPEIDCIATHLGLVDYWLIREFQTR